MLFLDYCKLNSLKWFLEIDLKNISYTEIIQLIRILEKLSSIFLLLLWFEEVFS